MAAVDDVARLRAIVGEPSAQVACKMNERFAERGGLAPADIEAFDRAVHNRYQTDL